MFLHAEPNAHDKKENISEEFSEEKNTVCFVGLFDLCLFVLEVLVLVIGIWFWPISNYSQNF